MRKIIFSIIMFFCIVSNVYAEPYQYVIKGTGNGKEVIGFIESQDNATLIGTIEGRKVTGEWNGMGSCEMTDGENFYEMEVIE